MEFKEELSVGTESIAGDREAFPLSFSTGLFLLACKCATCCLLQVFPSQTSLQHSLHSPNGYRSESGAPSRESCAEGCATVYIKGFGETKPSWGVGGAQRQLGVNR